MTKGELIAALADVPDGTKVVIDVDATQCISDRNVLDVSEVRLDEVADGVSMLFVQATGSGVTVVRLKAVEFAGQLVTSGNQ